MSNLIAIISELLIILIIVHARRQCASRDYGNGGTVCVCNTSYCDDLDAVRRTKRNTVTLYESSLSGHRFQETVLPERFDGSAHTFPNDIQAIQLRINTKKQFQKIVGFGGAFTDSTGINIDSLPVSLQSTLVSDYFSETGIEYNLCRVPVAGTDFSTRPYTYDDVTDDFDLTQFSLAEEDFKYKIRYMKMAQSVSANQVKLFGCPWSGPAWLKTSGHIQGGTLIGEPGNRFHKTWANYLVRFLEEYEKQGIKMWGLSVQNEPAFGYFANVTFNTMGYTPETERDFIIKDLGPTLERNGYGLDALKLLTGEDQRPETELNLFDGSVQNPSILQWADTVFGDREAAKYMAGIGFHWYFDTINDINLLDRTYFKYAEYFILQTEACNGVFDSDVLLGSWQRAESYAYDIITDLNHFTAGWVDWNMALDVTGGPNWINNFVDSPVIVNSSAGEYYKQPMFYALGHFSKFLATDSVRVELTGRAGVENFETTAFVRPDNGVVVIALNTNNVSVGLFVDDYNGRRISRVVSPHSIQTYIWWQ